MINFNGIEEISLITPEKAASLIPILISSIDINIINCIFCDTSICKIYQGKFRIKWIN